MAANIGESQGNDAAADVSTPIVSKSADLIIESVPWMDDVVAQALKTKREVTDSLNDAFKIAGSRIDRFLTTGSAHFDQSMYMLQDSFQDMKSEYCKYEDIAFGKMKDGIFLASSHPYIATGAVLGVGFLGVKRSRQFLWYKTIRAFVSEEALVARADAKVKELKQSFDLLKLESEKLEKRALQAEDDLASRKANTSAIGSAYKIERQASGLKDALKYLPSIEASRFRKQVSNLAKDLKKERSALSAGLLRSATMGFRSEDHFLRQARFLNLYMKLEVI